MVRVSENLCRLPRLRSTGLYWGQLFDNAIKMYGRFSTMVKTKVCTSRLNKMYFQIDMYKTRAARLIVVAKTLLIRRERVGRRGYALQGGLRF